MNENHFGMHRGVGKKHSPFLIPFPESPSVLLL
uniref:Uncharacterized protein n=1 Tax=Anguilla anguilla TaxID=7936 RepID=A0A0E9WLZ3_ANGAN